jgi:hypothetical protein
MSYDNYQHQQQNFQGGAYYPQHSQHIQPSYDNHNQDYSQPYYEDDNFRNVGGNNGEHQEYPPRSPTKDSMYPRSPRNQTFQDSAYPPPSTHYLNYEQPPLLDEKGRQFSDVSFAKDEFVPPRPSFTHRPHRGSIAASMAAAGEIPKKEGLRMWRSDEHVGELTRGGKRRTCLRFCCCFVVLLILLLVGIILGFLREFAHHEWDQDEILMLEPDFQSGFVLLVSSSKESHPQRVAMR